MNENLDLVKILKDCPKGTKLYSTVQGEVVFNGVSDTNTTYYPIDVCIDDKIDGYTRDGRFDKRYDGECVLFPSKDQRDWSKFKVPVEKFDYNTLQPFDKVLVRDRNSEYWRCGLFSWMLSNGMLCECRWNQGIPYNDETKHLVGTKDEAPIHYRYWED